MTRSASPLRVSRVTRGGIAALALLMLSAISALPALPALPQPPAAGATASMRSVSAIRYAHHAPQAAAAMPDVEKLRRDLLRRLNDLRAATGTPPLRLSPALDRAAQQHVDEIAASGSLRRERRPEQAMDERLREAGYDAHQWAENVMSGPADAAELVSAWRADDSDGTFRRVLDPVYSDLGIGVGRLGSAPLYSILFASPQSEAFARETADLRDLGRVRGELLARINAERRRARRQPLSLNAALDQAAQRHAEDMLARSYFAHRSPDGKTVRERARLAGYEWSAIGENLAEGQQSVDEVVEAWMRSHGHRENILDRRYTETGFGLALGHDLKKGEYRILWVETFGLPR